MAPGPLAGMPVSAIDDTPLYRTTCWPLPMTAHPPLAENAPRPATGSDVLPAFTWPDGCARPDASDVGTFAPRLPSAVLSVYVVVVLSAIVVRSFSCAPPAAVR